MSLFVIRPMLRLGVGFLAITTIFQNCGGGSSTPSTPATPVPQIYPVQSRIAFSASSFVNSIGVVTHLGQNNYEPASYAKLNTDILSLGVEHVRDSSYAAGSENGICAEDASLAAQGIRFDFATSVGMSQADVQAWISCTGNATDAFEPYNEYDLNHATDDTNWPQELGAFQMALYANIKNNPATANITVLGPSLTSATAYAKVGNLENYLDYGNIHSYQGGFYPETTGFGPGGYGSLVKNDANGALVAGAKPNFVTETTYATYNTVNTVDQATQAKYVDRTYLYAFSNGVPRTYYYELLDEPNIPKIGFATAGLMDQTGAAKPSYTQLKATLSLLADPVSSAAVVPLTYGITGNLAHVSTLLFQKQDGDYYLAIWQARSSYDTNTETPVVVEPQAVTIEVPGPPAMYYAISSFNSSGNITTTVAQQATAIAMDVTDNVQFVHLSAGPF